MQKHLLHHLILLLTLIFGSGAAAWAAHTTAIVAPSAEAPMTESLHLFDHKSFEQVGDVYVEASSTELLHLIDHKPFEQVGDVYVCI
jgi:hypothetical protein